MLLSYRNLTVSYGGPKLLNNSGLTITKRDRICLLGRNGEGKSTLLRIINGEIAPDKGESESIPELRIGKLDQEVPDQIKGSVFQVVAEGLGKNSSKKLTKTTKKQKRSLTNKERKALETLTLKIVDMEDEYAKLSALMVSADYYQDPACNLTGDSQKARNIRKRNSTSLLESRSTEIALTIR